MGPLSGYRVLDITQMIAGPLGCELLGDMGAEVIKVEPIDGESTRHTAGVIPMEGLGFILYNRGKRSIPVDLRQPEGRDVVHRLVQTADVVVVGYRPDVCLQFGLDYERLAGINPRIVYLQNTAFGSQGPMAQQGGYDIVVQGLSGLMALNQGVDDEGQPRPIVPAYADYLTAAYIAWGVTAALMVRERTGEGQKVETSLLASALMGQVGRLRYFDALDADTTQQFLDRLQEMRRENRPWKEQLALRAERLIPANIYYRAYASADSYLIVACLNNPTRVKFLEITGLEDFRMVNGRLITAVEPGEDTPERRERLRKLVEKAETVMRSKTTAQWLGIFTAAKIPTGPLRFPEEVFFDEQVLANGYVERLEHPIAGPYRTAAPPVRMSKTPLAIQGPAPTFGQHAREILVELGYDQDTIDALVARRIIADGPP
ncbi:MAG TPA: CoA transferase [Dehalococcoidia bacterium]|nr:CoA transferase [Dehalococcoidia bacterium]